MLPLAATAAPGDVSTALGWAIVVIEAAVQRDAPADISPDASLKARDMSTEGGNPAALVAAIEGLDLAWPKPALALADLAALEAGAIANPDEGRMVGHYWLRNPALAPTPE